MLEKLKTLQDRVKIPANIPLNAQHAKYAVIGAALLGVAGGAYLLNSGAEAYGLSGYSAEKSYFSDDAKAWSAIRNSTDVNELNEFVRKYPNSDYAGFANNRLLELSPVEAATSVAEETVDTSSSSSIVEDKARVRVLQAELARVGCKPGRMDGDWGYSGKMALAAYNAKAKTSFDIENPTEEAISAVQETTYRVCSDADDGSEQNETAEVEETVSKPSSVSTSYSPKPKKAVKKVKKRKVYKKKSAKRKNQKARHATKKKNYSPRKRKVYRKKRKSTKRRGSC